MSQIKRKSFILYLDFAESFQYLSMEERGLLLTIIYDYVSGQPIPNDLPNMVKMAFSFIRKTLDRDGAAYEERCRIAIENGKKGGRPRKETIHREKTERVFQKPDNDNDNDNDNVNVIDIGNGIGNDFANEDWEITPSAQAPIWDSAPITSSALCSADIQTEEQDLFALGGPP